MNSRNVDYLILVSAGGKGHFPPYKRLTNGLPCSHEQRGHDLHNNTKETIKFEKK